MSMFWELRSQSTSLELYVGNCPRMHLTQLDYHAQDIQPRYQGICANTCLFTMKRSIYVHYSKAHQAITASS